MTRATRGDEIQERQRPPLRALVLHDRPLVVGLIELTLDHGFFVVRAARSLAEANTILRAPG